MSTMKSRRQFIQSLIATGTLAACSDDIPDHRYTDKDRALLAKQRITEAFNSGRSRFGKQVYQGYHGLAELPWFEMNQEGRLVCVDQTIPPVIDVHCHAGMSLLFEPDIDHLSTTPQLRHLLDCDSRCELDLDVYMNGNFSEPGLGRLRKNLATQALWGNDLVRTQTMGNLLRQMDDLQVEQAMLLPIKFGFPFGDSLTEDWRLLAQKGGISSRIKVGFSVDPHDDDAIESLRQHAAQGLKLMKLHPPLQRFFPDDPKVYPLYEEAQELGVIIFFHGGRAGIELEASEPYAMPRHYEAAFKNFPNLNFILGHAGARDVDAMLELMWRYDNAYLGIQGQGVGKLDTIINKTGGERLLFGSDWPFYHIAATLAKIFIVTDVDSRQSIRHRILRYNAERLFAA